MGQRATACMYVLPSQLSCAFVVCVRYCAKIRRGEERIVDVQSGPDINGEAYSVMSCILVPVTWRRLRFCRS